MKKRKKIISLRAKTTLLCAAIISLIAAGLTFASIFSADRIFFGSENYGESVITTKSAQEVMEQPVTAVLPDGTIQPQPDIASFEVRQKGEDGQALAAQAPGAEVSAGDAVDVDPGETMAMSVTVAKKSAFAWVNIALMILLVLAGIWAAYFLTGRALKPISSLSHKIHEMDENNLSERIDENTACAEVSHLTDAFNKMLGRLDTAFQSQKQFASAAAHELKTPLASMQTNLEVLELEEPAYDEELKHTLTVLKKNIVRMNELVDDLLAMNAHRSLELEEDCDFSALVTEAVKELGPEIEKKQISLVRNCEGKICGNRNLIGRAVFNLIENAVKYNRPDGWVEIAAAEESEEVVFAVHNSGAGIPPQELEHIFEPFYRVDKSRSRDIAGSGLGLAIVKSIVELHGGSISVRSNEEETVFEARFRKERAKAPA